MVSDPPEHVMGLTSRRPAVRSQESGVRSQVTDGSKYRGWVPRSGSILGLQSHQISISVDTCSSGLQCCSCTPPNNAVTSRPDKKSTYLKAAEGGPWPGVSGCLGGDPRPSVRWRLNTLLALSNLDLVHRLASSCYTSQSALSAHL